MLATSVQRPAPPGATSGARAFIDGRRGLHTETAQSALTVSFKLVMGGSIIVVVLGHIQKTKIMASGPITSWEIDGETVETVSDFIFGVPNSLHMVTAAMKLKDAYSLEGKL